MHNCTFFCLKKKLNQCIVDIRGSMYRKAIKECFQPFLNVYFIWHAASNNGINLLIINNRNYNLKGRIDNYDFCHNRADNNFAESF